MVKNLKDLAPVQNRVAAAVAETTSAPNARYVDHMTSSQWRMLMGHIGHAGIVITQRSREIFRL